MSRDVSRLNHCDRGSDCWETLMEDPAPSHACTLEYREPSTGHASDPFPTMKAVAQDTGRVSAKMRGCFVTSNPTL